jgi:prolyl oligopeptidase
VKSSHSGALRCHLTVLVLAGLALSLSAQQTPSLPNPPDTPKRPVVDDYHGIKVTDDYRWLENWDDPATKQWSSEQNARSRAYLDSLPSRAAIKQRVTQLIHDSSPRYSDLEYRGGVLFGRYFQPPQQQAKLITLRSADDPTSAKVIFDPNTAAGKESLAIDFYVPSLDGKYVAVAASGNGSEESDGHVFEVATGKELPDVVKRVNFATAGGSIAWNADSSGFYYTRYPQANERPAEDLDFYQQVYFHKLGTDSKQDTYVIGKEFPRIAEIHLRTSENGHWLIASVANGGSGWSKRCPLPFVAQRSTPGPDSQTDFAGGAAGTGKGCGGTKLGFRDWRRCTRRNRTF